MVEWEDIRKENKCIEIAGIVGILACFIIGVICDWNVLAKYIGYYLGKQQSKNNTVNQHVWADVLSRWSLFSTYNIPEERKEDFLRIKMNTYFCYCYGMLFNRQENIVKQGLYLKGMKQTVKIDNKYHAILYIAVHCYVYYLAVRESDNCVPADIRQSAKNIWDDKIIKDAFIEFLNMLAETPEWLDLETLDLLHGIVDRFELFPQYESFKSMIIEHVVSDFYLFLILFMSQEFYLPELVERNIDDVNAYRYVLNGNDYKTKEMIKELFNAVYIGNKSEERIAVEVDLMYDDLEKTVKNKQKERYIELAKAAQEKYETNMNEEEICAKIKKDTIKSIKEKFAPILTESDEKNGILRIKLLTITNNTDFIGEKDSTDGYHSDIAGVFLYRIVHFLYQRKVLELKKRFEDFSDDKEFMKYLETNELHTLLGSQHVLKNKDYRLNDEYKRFMEDYETIYTAILPDGIGLKKDSIRVCLHDVNVSIHSPNIKESKVEFDQKSPKYKYSIINSMAIDFEEEELREFLYNNYKVINITAKISIQVNEKPCGTLFTRKERR